MVDPKYVQDQLKKINFGSGRVNRSEIEELQHILLEGEIIYECVNGFYEGGVALLVATDIRVLLIDKKPMGFLNVDDLRFDMISDIDYSHRAFGSQISINCGMKSLVFKNYNRTRLRKLIGHVQHRMSEIKKEQSEHASMQKQHLEEINKQLQMYLLAQHQQLQRQMGSIDTTNVLPKPDPQLSDYLFAQRLMDNFYNKNKSTNPLPEQKNNNLEVVEKDVDSKAQQALIDEMVEAGKKEILGEKENIGDHAPQTSQVDITPFRIAYAKLPYLLRNRRFKRYTSGFQP